MEIKGHASLKLFENKIEFESKRLLRKNKFILKLIYNGISCNFDKDFNTLR